MYMADDELDGLDQPDEKPDKAELRIRNLSEKVKTTAQERDEIAKAKEEAEAARVAAEKERDFFKDFNTSSTKYPGATEYQDAIKEKVMGGYSVEDATVAVLAREGKLGMAPAPEPQDSPAGGSAPTAMSTPGDKSPSDMTQEERKAALVEAQSRGEFSLN